MAIEHDAIVDGERHEPKGISSATSGQVYVANGATSGTWQIPANAYFGSYLYEDTTTTGTPIAFTLANTQYELTNDGAGASSITFPTLGVADIWDVATNRFDFSGMALGDGFELRLTGQFVTSGANHALSLWIEFGIGGTPFQIPLLTQSNFKNAATHTISTHKGFFMGSTNVLNNPARILGSSDNTGDTFIIDEFYISVTRRV